MILKFKPTMDNRFFYNALLFSMLLHSSVLLWFSWNHKDFFKRPMRRVEVTYTPLKAVGPVKRKMIKAQTLEDKKLPLITKVLPLKNDVSKNFMRDVKKSPEKILISKKEVTRFADYDGKKMVSIPVLTADKLSNPKYLTYNEAIGNSIRMNAINLVQNANFESGEVYTTFVVARNGVVLAVKVIDEKSSAGPFLKGVALRSIRESSPFPYWPEGLNYPELTFNVVISFHRISQ